VTISQIACGAGAFKSSSNDIKGGATRLTRPSLQLVHGYDINSRPCSCPARRFPVRSADWVAGSDLGRGARTGASVCILLCRMRRASALRPRFWRSPRVEVVSGCTSGNSDRERKQFRQGEKAMSTSAHTLLSKSKRVAGMAIGAIAMRGVFRNCSRPMARTIGRTEC
jgi:hypothetical protein